MILVLKLKKYLFQIIFKKKIPYNNLDNFKVFIN